MLQTAKKSFVLGLIACLAGLLTPIGGGAEVLQTDKTLQPQGLNYAGIYQLRQMAPNLTGSGIRFAVICRSITYIDGEPQNDYRPNADHTCFKAGQLGFHDQAEPPAGISPHSTAICSILLGEDHNAFDPNLGDFRYQGIAPQAQADVYEFWYFLINNVFPHSLPNADVVTAGIGNQIEDWWTRGIDSMAQQYGLIVVAGIGNGSNAFDPPLYPAASANVIGVGVVDSVNTESPEMNLANFSLAHPQHSSVGPTADGRCKPDIVAAGNCLAAIGSEPNRYEPTGNWSSFSTPIVAGTVGLLVQEAKQDVRLSSAVATEGGNCVIKAILLNSAKKLPYWHKGRAGKDDDHRVPLDYIQGAGMLNAVGAYEHLIAGPHKPGNVPTIGWDNNVLSTNRFPENAYRITIKEPKGKFITATAVWNKHYKSEYPFEPVPDEDANLRLELWAINPEEPGDYYLLDYSDSSVDNVEHIYIAADANYTDYEIVVSHSIDNLNQIPAGHRYALAWNISKKQDNDSIFWYDLNTDGIVNDLDFTTFLDNWITSIKSPGSYFYGDINGNGVIDVNDAEILLGQKNRQADWYTENTPE